MIWNETLRNRDSIRWETDEYPGWKITLFHGLGYFVVAPHGSRTGVFDTFAEAEEFVVDRVRTLA